MTVDPRKAPDTPEDITIEFDQGVAVKVSGAVALSFDSPFLLSFLGYK